MSASTPEVGIQLTPEQSIQILEEAKKILGENGERWIKGHWVGLPYDEDDEDYDPADLDGYQDVGWSEASNPDAVFCIMGALELAAYRLGITSKPEMSDRLARPISIQNLVEQREEWKGFGSPMEVNDSETTNFETIKNLIEERLSELRAEPENTSETV